jgi:UDP-GlcNAc:undecaprenyl-phosphate GlcNAc-1-phosphate transferase
MNLLLLFLVSFLLCALVIPLIKKLAHKTSILDIPKSERKIHSRPIPLLGGLGIFLSFSIILIIYLFFGKVNFNTVPIKYFCGIFLGGLILILGGILDDKYELPPKFAWLFPALASLTAICLGIGSSIHQISNPFGKPIALDYSWAIGHWHLTVGSLFSWIWLMGMIYTTKFLDGLDGLCSGISLIGGLTLFLLSLLPHINQNITASIAIIFCGSVAGFLLYNFNPASIFLGEGGSTFLGFMLGIISIILGGKIATALLVMGIPILDVAWVITRRLWYKTSPFRADRKHLHFRLLDLGFSQRQTVAILWSLALIFGFTAVFLQSLGKLIALGILVVVMIFLALAVVMLYKKQHPHLPKNKFK